MREHGAAVVHLSPHAVGEPEIRVDNAGGIAAMIGGAGRARPPADRVPGRPPVPVRGPRAAGRLSPGPGGRGARVRRAAGREHGLRSCRAAPWQWTPCSRARRPSRPSARRTTCSRWAPFAGSTSAGIRVPDEVSVAGFDDISIAAMTAPGLSTVRPPAARDGPPRVPLRGPPAGRPSPGDEPSRPRSSCAARPAAAGGALPAARAGSPAADRSSTPDPLPPAATRRTP